MTHHTSGLDRDLVQCAVLLYAGFLGFLLGALLLTAFLAEMGAWALAALIAAGFMLYCAPFVLISAFACTILAGASRSGRAWRFLERARRWPGK